MTTTMIILKELQDKLVETGFKKFRAVQVIEAIYKKGIDDFQAINNIPKELKDFLHCNFKINSLELLKTSKSASGDTEKYLYLTHDGKKIETVLMKFKDGRNTVCVSSQVGCKLGCRFCATGKMGFGRDLTFSEICDQLLIPYQKLIKKNNRISNVVYMGMGEPLLNYDNVLKSVKFLNHKSYFGIGARNITISTAGIAPEIKKLADEGIQFNLAVSLHAPDQVLREKIMPVAKMYPLDTLMNAIKYYTSKTNRRVTYEYIMLKDINDSRKDAIDLAELIKDQLCHVNLIPYNATDVEGMSGSAKKTIEQFQEVLEQYNIAATTRVSLGQDIEAPS